MSEPDSNVNNSRSKFRSILKLGRYLPLLLLLGLGVHFFLPIVASLENTARILRSMVFEFVALAFLMETVGYYLGMGYMLSALVALEKQRLSLKRGALMLMGANSIGLVAGGLFSSAAMTYRWLNQHGSRREWAAIAGVLPSSFVTIVLAGIAIFGLIQLFVLEHLTRLQVIGFGLSMLPTLALVVVLLLGSAYRGRVERLVVWLGSHWARIWKRPFDPTRIQKSIANFYFAWELLRGGKWRRPLLGAAIYCVLDMSVLYCIFLAAGHPISPAVLLTGYGLPLLFGRAAFILPGGVGIVESSMAAIYTTLGVPNALSVVVVLSYRLIAFWLPSLLGFVAVFILGRTKGRPAEEM